MPELEVRGFTKRYGRAVAVDDLSFAVEAGRGHRLPRPQRRQGGLDQITGGLVLAAWAAGLVAIGIALICRRDVAD